MYKDLLFKFVTEIVYIYRTFGLLDSLPLSDNLHSSALTHHWNQRKWLIGLKKKEIQINYPHRYWYWV